MSLGRRAIRTTATGSRHHDFPEYRVSYLKEITRRIRRGEDRREAEGLKWEEEPTRQCRGYNPDTGRWCEARVTLDRDHCGPCVDFLQRMWDEEDAEYNWTKWEQVNADGEYLS